MKRHLIIVAVIAFTVTMALAVGSPQQPQKVLTDPEFTVTLQNLHPQEVKSLKGIKGIAVVIDRLDSNLVAAGLRGEDVRNSAEALLRGVKVQILNLEQWKKEPGYPFLKVKIETDSETIKNKPYTGLVKAALTQYVALHRQLSQSLQISTGDTTWRTVVDTKDMIFAETWHTQRTFKVNDIKGIQDAAIALVAEFVHEYEQANK